MTPVSLNTTIEELIDRFPEAVTYLMDQGIRCIRCGEPMWGTLGDAMAEKRIPADRQQELLSQLLSFVTTVPSEERRRA